MNAGTAKSKKRAHRDITGRDTDMKSLAPKKAKTGKKSSERAKMEHISIPISTLKSQYDAAFPAGSVVGHDMPVYLMAQNYINLYGMPLLFIYSQDLLMIMLRSPE